VGQNNNKVMEYIVNVLGFLSWNVIDAVHILSHVSYDLRALL
jgi:hypothetical protein